MAHSLGSWKLLLSFEFLRIALAAAVSIAGVLATRERNLVWTDGVKLWRSALAVFPGNAKAHNGHSLTRGRTSFGFDKGVELIQEFGKWAQDPLYACNGLEEEEEEEQQQQQERERRRGEVSRPRVMARLECNRGQLCALAPSCYLVTADLLFSDR